MASPGSRWKVILVLLSIAAIFTTMLNLASIRSTNAVSLNKLPLVIGSFAGKELPVEQHIKDILETPNVMMRNYTGPNGAHVALAIVYYDQYRVYFHMPDGCMVGRGTIVVASERESVGIPEGRREPIIVNKLVLKHPETNEYVFYFFMAGDLITPSYTHMRIHLMLNHLKRRQVGASLVRFSITADEEYEEMALKTLKDFIRQAAETLPTYLN